MARIIPGTEFIVVGTGWLFWNDPEYIPTLRELVEKRGKRRKLVEKAGKDTASQSAGKVAQLVANQGKRRKKTLRL